MLSLESSEIKKSQCIKIDTFENLSVIPYIRGRLVFAELAARVIEDGEFDLVVVDLPYFMNGKVWLDVPVRLFPYVSSLVIRKADSTFVNFPFVPNDAACASVASALKLKDTGIPVEITCIDDSNMINYPRECLSQPSTRIKDDYFVFTEGIGDYYVPLFNQLERIWYQLSGDKRFFLEYRAGIMAERLRQSLRQGRNTLFVCEYRMWWFISKILGNKNHRMDRQFFHKWNGLDAALVIGDPYLFWANGMLDDYPAVVSHFYERLQLGALGSFDKLKALDDTIKNTFRNSTKKEFTDLSIRQLIIFEQYLLKRLAMNRTLTPPFLPNLYDTAHSCLGKGFAKEMARKLLQYPYPEMDEVLNYFNIQYEDVMLGQRFSVPDLSSIPFFHTGPHKFSFDNLRNDYTSTEELIEFANKVCHRITKKELKELGDVGVTEWAVTDDYRLHEIACAKVRDIVERKRHGVIVRRSFGSMGDGIHWKATISSRAKGEDAIYIKIRRKAIGGKLSRLDEFTPVAFIFANDISKDHVQTISDFNITQRLIELGKKDLSLDTLPPPDYVYSVLYTSSETDSLYKGHIYKRRLSSISFLYTRHVMGVERYAGITKRPARFQCRINTLSDPELKDFSYSELGVAWAIKYAEDAVLVVARDGWQASRELEDFARAKNVRIILIPLFNFSHDFIERLRTLHFISTSLKNYPEMGNILRRFIG